MPDLTDHAVRFGLRQHFDELAEIVGVEKALSVWPQIIVTVGRREDGSIQVNVQMPSAVHDLIDEHRKGCNAE